MTSSSRITFMNCPLDAITMDESLQRIESAMASNTLLQHVVVNVAKLVNMQRDEALRRDVTTSDLINIDGAGVVLGARLMGHVIPERVTGIDLMEHILRLCHEKGYRPYILGAKQEVLEQAVANIQQRYPNITFAGYRNGYFNQEEEPAIIKAIADSQADCLFIAMPTPHKERLMHDYKTAFHVPFLMGVGGSVDIMAGITKRAPRWMQRAGLEWLYRLLQEPKRMWKRYAVTNGLFAWLMIKELLTGRKQSHQG